MITVPVLIAISIFSMGCSQSATETADTAIAKLYNAEVEGSMSQLENQTTVYEINVRNSAMIDTLKPKLTASNIALLAFEGLQKPEKEKAAGVVVNLWTTSGQTATYSFSRNLLLQVSEKAEVYRILSDKIVNKDFKYIDDNRDISKMEDPFGDRFEAYITHLESNLGKLKSFESFGIREVNDEYGHEFHFFGHLVFEKSSFPYKIDLDVNPENNKWVGLLLKQGID